MFYVPNVDLWLIFLLPAFFSVTTLVIQVNYEKKWLMPLLDLEGIFNIFMIYLGQYFY